jgi:hypothetical protein
MTADILSQTVLRGDEQNIAIEPQDDYVELGSLVNVQGRTLRGRANVEVAQSPSAGRLRLRFSGDWGSEVSLRVVDVQGRCVWSGRVRPEAGECDIRLTGANGVYFVDASNLLARSVAKVVLLYR